MEIIFKHDLRGINKIIIEWIITNLYRLSGTTIDKFIVGDKGNLDLNNFELWNWSSSQPYPHFTLNLFIPFGHEKSYRKLEISPATIVTDLLLNYDCIFIVPDGYDPYYITKMCSLEFKIDKTKVLTKEFVIDGNMKHGVSVAKIIEHLHKI